jgi:hypothetical protein
MDSEGRLQLAKLSSVNYRSWSMTIKLVLASKDLVGYIESSLNDLIEAKTRELTSMAATPEVVVATTEGSGDNATSPALSATSAPSTEIQKAIVTATDLV